MKLNLRNALAVLLTAQLVGCSVLSESSFVPDAAQRLAERRAEKQAESEVSGQIANPPAKTMRFDGHEIVLGESESASLDVDRLVSMLEPLILEQRMQTATALITRHRETGERLLAERWASQPNSGVVQLVAEVLSRRSTSSDANYKSLLTLAKNQRANATEYQDLRNRFADELRDSEPASELSDRLLQASLKLSHPLVRVDALRLLGLRELVAGRHAWAESQFRQAIDIASSSGNPLVAADLWLTVAEATRRSGQMETSTTAWSNAVNLQVSANQDTTDVDTSFWLMADKTKAESANWPNDVGQILGQKIKSLGLTSPANTEMTLWSAIAQSQYQRGEMQTALVSFKRAETLANGQNALWLRIAQAKCLAGMSQAPAAAAILSGPAASSDPNVAAAAMAAMGSIKLQTGAYQQGAQLLIKALEQINAAAWPGRNQALADLAVARLIFGDTESGLSALHDAQLLLEQSGERALLLQSLDNELRLLEHEHRADPVASIKAKIQQLERL